MSAEIPGGTDTEPLLVWRKHSCLRTLTLMCPLPLAGRMLNIREKRPSQRPQAGVLAPHRPRLRRGQLLRDYDNSLIFLIFDATFCLHRRLIGVSGKILAALDDPAESVGDKERERCERGFDAGTGEGPVPAVSLSGEA